MRYFLSIMAALVCAAICNAQHIPVDPLTGRANISIPIWDIKEGNLSAPIFVAYSGGGVRVNESEGSAGMSWNLYADGQVGRVLNGLPDDFLGAGGDTRKGWLYNSLAQTINSFAPAADDNLAICSDEVNDYNFINNLQYTNDTEPDAFHFSAPGLSGQFVFGSDGLPKTIPYQDLKFEIVRAGGTGPIDQVKITNNKGIIYTFDVKETTTKSRFQVNSATIVKHFKTEFNQYSTDLTYTSAWKLSRISSPTGAEIVFSYTNHTMASSVRKVITIDASSVESDRYRIREEVTPKRLQSVASDAITAEFSWEEQRISKITVRDNHFDKTKEFDFVYSNVKDYRKSGFAARRSFLKEIRQGEDCVTTPAYTFSYNSIDQVTGTCPLPFDDDNLQDLWGFYNGTSATKVPDIYVYNSQPDAERYRFRPIPGQPADVVLAGAGRTVNPLAVDVGSLSQIVYPTGASATITFEPNSFYDDAAGDTVQGGGVRVKKVRIATGEKGSEAMETHYQYKQANGVTSGKLIYRPVFAFAGGDSVYRSPENLAPDGGVMYTRTTVKQTGKGKTVYDFLVPAMYPQTSASDWAAAKSKIARASGTTPCQSVGNQVTGYYTYPFAPNTNYDFERGLTDKISDYAENGTLVQERIFGYQRLSTSSILLKGLRFEVMPTNNFIYSQYTLLANIGKVMVTETTRRADDLTPANKIEIVNTYVYNSTHQMLESISTTNSDGIIRKTKYKYAKDFSSLTNPNTSKPEAVAIKNLNDNFRHGELMETIQYRKEGANPDVAIGASLTLFKDFGSGKALPHTQLEFPAVAGFTEATVSGSPQVLSYHSSYLPVTVVQTYNPVGLPLSVTDNKKNRSGIHYGFSNSIALATVSNALTEETVYDGFETSSSFNLPASGGTTSIVSGAWTGQNARSVISSTVLRRDNVQKAFTLYRFSCYVKASGTPQVTFRAKNGATIQSTASVTYSGAGQWQYLEGTLNMTPVSSVFSLEVVTNAAAELDDIRFFPANASLVVSSVQPLSGITSQSDDRGVTVFNEYDELGRLHFVKDRNKNIVKVNDYRYQKETAIPLNSNFTDNEPAGGIHTNDGAEFTAPVNCGNPTYIWTVDGTQVSTASTLNHSFTTEGSHTVELTVSSTSGFVKTVKEYCVTAVTGTLQLSASDQNLYQCETETHQRTITASAPQGCSNLSNLLHTWYYKPASSGSWTFISSSASKSINFNIATVLGLQSYQMKCVVTAKCGVFDSPNGNCDGLNEFTAEQTISFTYVDNRPCP